MRFFLLTILLVAAISAFSGYTLPSFEDSSWATALFLTPMGIAQNFWEANALQTFYHDRQSGRPLPDLFGRVGIAVAYCLAAATFFWQSTRAKRGQK